MSPKAKIITYRPGTLGYYLREYGWEPVESGNDFPDWKKGDGNPMPASRALLEVYREIWKQNRKKGQEPGK